jgi:1,4-dihydroxy-2-naphthoate octaprenyltransferase
MFNAGLLVLALLAAVAVQAAANLFSDYFDCRGGGDSLKSYGSSSVVMRGLLQPSEVVLAALALTVFAAALGLYLGAICGVPVLILGALGPLGAYFYAGRPVAYKYRALGDPVIFLLFGPVVVLGGYYVQARAVELVPMLYALPVGCLLTAILHVTNTRDGRDGGGEILLDLLLAAPYLVVIAGVVNETFVRWSALALLSAPLAWNLARQAHTAPAPHALASLDVAAARLHLVFGVLLIVGVLLPVT